jgi:hypothetical protein
MVVAVAGAILWAVLSFKAIVDTIDDFQHVPVPGSGRVQLEQRKYIVYIEGPGADQSTPPFRIDVQDPQTERRVSLEHYSGSLTYSFDTDGSAVGTLTPPRAGAYVVRTSGVDEGPGYRLALGESIGGKIVRGIVGAFVIGGGFGVAGVVLLVVTGVRRSKRRAAPPTLPGLGVS